VGFVPEAAAERAMELFRTEREREKSKLLEKRN